MRAAGSESFDPSEGASLLAVGDVHLGTRVSGLSAGLSEYGLDARVLGPVAALGAAVDLAIAKRVLAVLLAGDVVESANARFEALPPLEGAVRRLREAGIPVLAVAGNHDVEALPRLARWVDGFELLGAGGRWESRVLEMGGRAVAEIVGWSFPEREVRSSPVAELLREPLTAARGGVPRVGLLHADLGASSGPYAPVSRHELDQAQLEAWLLGHIHKPSLGDGDASAGASACGYLGSLVGLDPSETGPHGPWLIRVGGESRVQAQHVPIAPLRWEQLEVRVAQDEDEEDLGDRILDEATKLASDIQQVGPAPRALGVRIRLVGRTRRYDAIHGEVEQERWNDLLRVVGETVVFVNKVESGLELAVDLDVLAKGDDLPGLLAQKLLALRRGGDGARGLLEAARAELGERTADARWRPLAQARDAGDPLSDESLASLLVQTGTAVLHKLLAQRDAEIESGS